MTKEEAIEKLEYAKTQCEWTFTPDFVTAFHMGILAIKKLEEVENILKTTRFNKGIWLNKDGEDFGCIEAIWEIADVLGFEPTEEENDKLQL